MCIASCIVHCARAYAAPIVYGGALLAGLHMGMYIHVCIAVHMIRDLSFPACLVIVLRSIT